VTRVTDGRPVVARDSAVTRAARSARARAAFAVIMRTPGATSSSLRVPVAERVLTSADEIGSSSTARRGRRHPENVVNVTLVGPASRDFDSHLAERRQTTTNSSCGLCGRRTIDRCAPTALFLRMGCVSAELLTRFPMCFARAVDLRADGRPARRGCSLPTVGSNTLPRMSDVTTGRQGSRRMLMREVLL